LRSAGYDPKQYLGGRARCLQMQWKYRPDAIVTSPPYAIPATTKGALDAEEGRVYQDKRKGRQGTQWEFSGQKELKHPSPDNIANLPYRPDVIVTSPPYEGSLEGSTRHTRGGIASRDPTLAQTGTYATTLSKATKQGVPVCYSPNKDNIGNLKGQTYLEAMFQVYSECHKVLKPGGRMALIIKPFVRNKRVVDLPFDTYRLCQAVGFRLEEIIKFVLPTESFWRIIYRRKYPNVERIAHEYVLIFRR